MVWPLAKECRGAAETSQGYSRSTPLEALEGTVFLLLQTFRFVALCQAAGQNWFTRPGVSQGSAAEPPAVCEVQSGPLCPGGLEEGQEGSWFYVSVVTQFWATVEPPANERPTGHRRSQISSRVALDQRL